MPTGENNEPAGGRVTRSLRKRLTSIDGDAPSRPGTPNSINLQTIPETNTPKKRVTRRASLSTPSTVTPSKETTNTPGRRITRRRSVNISESEDQAIPIISKEPTIAVVKEEEPEVETPKEKTKRVLRSSSKSPNDPDSTKKKKATNQEEEEEQDIIILDDSLDSSQTLKPPTVTKKTKISIKKENISEFSGTDSTPSKKSPNISASQNNSSKKYITADSASPTRDDSENMNGKKRSSGAGNVTPKKSSSKQDSLSAQTTPEILKSDKGSGRKSRSAQKEKQISEVNSPSLIFEQIETSRGSPSAKKNLSNITADTARLSLTNKNLSSPARKQQSSQNSPFKKNHPEPLKNVAFNEEADENTVKNVYPKTPGLIKSKSYILDASNDVDKDETFKSKKGHSLEEMETKSDKENSDEEETADLNSKTPYKLKLMAVESSTPIQNKSPKQNKTSEMQGQKEKSTNENPMEVDEGVVAFPKSWSKSVSGTTRETSKIDCIVSEKSLKEKQAEEAINISQSNSSHNSSKNKLQQHYSEISDAEDDLLEEDDDEFDDEEERDRNAEKTIFLDDEAMEVAEGEESMDSEERQYLEENEIPEYGESIGSEDSEEDDDCEDEPDEEDAAFVVSDTEVIEEFLSSEDEIEKSEQKKKLNTSDQKKYKRILQRTESSEEESKPVNKDESNFCLFVDSSLDEENTENEAHMKSPNKSLKKKRSHGIKDKSAKDKSLKADNKLDKSKKNKTVEEDVLDKKNGEEKEGKPESPTNILIEKNNSKKDVTRKSDVKNNAESNLSKEKLLTEDIEMQEECSNATQDDASQKNEEKLTAVKSSEIKKLTKSPNRKSINQDLVCEDGFDGLNEKLLNKSRKSVDASGNVENFTESRRKSLIESKSPSKMSTISDAESDNVSKNNEEERVSLKSLEKKTLTKSPKRKTLTLTGQDESEVQDKCNSPKDSGKSINKSDDSFESIHEKSINQPQKSITKSTDASANEEILHVSQRKSIGNTSIKNVSVIEGKENSKDRKSLNESRKSLVRTSTEETNETEDQSTVENTQLSLERSEPEETLSASEGQPDNSAGKTLNMSKKLRKSFDHNSSLLSEHSNGSEKSKRRKSIVQQIMMQRASESCDSAEEDVGKSLPDSLQNEESKNESVKSMRRKSIVQQIMMQRASESSDSEKEDEGKSPPDLLQNEESKNESEKSMRRKSIVQHSFGQKTSGDAEEENEGKSSPEVTDHESSNDDPAEAQFSDDENVATDKTISDFLGEEDKSESSLKQNCSRRKSIAINESKLDETFQLDPKKSLSSSLHDSLHRSIFRKSLNQSQSRSGANTADMDEEKNLQSDSEEADSSSDEELKIQKKIVSDKGLSVSLNSIQIKKKKLKNAKAIRNSFTIGVSVRKNSSENEDSPESVSGAGNKISLENVASSENEDPLDNEYSSSLESKLLNVSEEKVLEKVKDGQHVGPCKSRKSMSNSILLPPPSDGDINQKKRIKRTSLYLEEETASHSFVENLAEEKKKINRQKRKSNSFCGVVAPTCEDDDFVRPKEPRSEKKQKKSFESKTQDESVKNVLSRCDQMIEAANEAKRIAKLQAKKVKVKKPKRLDKEEKATEVDKEVEIPLVSKKEIKRKEKIKKELTKALKQSASVLSKVIEPVKKSKKHAPSQLESTNIDPTKRLETEFLESLVALSNPNKKKTKEIETTPPSDKENSKKKSNKLKYKIEDIHTKLESDIETLETACGTVIVEPSTPKKLRFQHGFRESPKTPIGFKIQNINSTDKKADKKCSRKLKTPSGPFVEEDLTTSKRKNPNKQKSLKRKLSRIEEPTYTLPKTQWTPSGVFVEEDLSKARPLANSTATQFLVASLSSGKKNNSSSEVISSTTLNKALSFKKNALKKSKVKRQQSREILHVKQRKIVNNQF